MVGTYNYWLVLLSVMDAITASYVALDLTSRVVAARGRKSESFWLIGGAIAMGCGIWSMHFVGMLAFRTPVRVTYDVPITGLSLLIAMTASWFALFVASRRTLSLRRLLGGGLLMGFAISAMHYTGMAAMRMAPPVHYDAALVVLSVIIAFGASIVSLWSGFQLRLETIITSLWKKVGSAAVMGAGICAMHYTGMAGAMFTPISISTLTSPRLSQVGLADALGGFTLAFMIAMLLVSALEAYRAELSATQAERLKVLHDESELRSKELFRINGLLQEEAQVRAQAEQALREARDKLETRVIERTAELVQSNESLQAQERALRESEQQLRRLFDEREHLIRDLHDNTVQSIYAAGMNLEEVKRLIQIDPVRASAEVVLAVANLNRVIRDIRRYIDGSTEHRSAPLSDNLGKLAELSRSISNPRFDLKIDAAAAHQLTPDAAEQLLQTAREAISNSRRHSGARHGTIALGLIDEDVVLEISDDGDGFDPEMEHDGSGLYNMKARAQEIGARLEILSSPGKGTRVVVRVPKRGGSQ